MKPSIAPLVQYAQKQIDESCEIKQGFSLELLSRLCSLAGRTADAFACKIIVHYRILEKLGGGG